MLFYKKLFFRFLVQKTDDDRYDDDDDVGGNDDDEDKLLLLNGWQTKTPEALFLARDIVRDCALPRS